MDDRIVQRAKGESQITEVEGKKTEDGCQMSEVGSQNGRNGNS